MGKKNKNKSDSKATHPEGVLLNDEQNKECYALLKEAVNIIELVETCAENFSPIFGSRKRRKKMLKRLDSLRLDMIDARVIYLKPPKVEKKDTGSLLAEAQQVKGSDPVYPDGTPQPPIEESKPTDLLALEGVRKVPVPPGAPVTPPGPHSPLRRRPAAPVSKKATARARAPKRAGR